MATTKIWAVRDNLKRVLGYAENHLKTANPNVYTAKELKDLHNVLSYAVNNKKTAKQFYVSGVNCIGKIAYQQMSATKQRFGKTGGNLAYHAYQSFAPDELTPEYCHKVGVELAERLWGDKYEVLVTTHLNTHCVHNHFVINSVSFVDGLKIDNGYCLYFNGLRKESDRICREHELSVIDKPRRSRGNRWIQQAEQRGEPTLYNIVKSDIDTAIHMSMTERQFFQKMRDLGYSFNFSDTRKYPTIRAPGQKHNIRLKTLGEDYTPDIINRRILENKRVFVPAQPPKRNIRHYHYQGNFVDMRRVSGLYILYLLFTLILRRISKRVPNQPQRTVYTPALRAAIRQMDKYSAETRLLWQHKIETPEQLSAFIENRNEQRKTLERERGNVYNRMKSAKTPEKLQKLKSERDELSSQIKIIRKELFYANDVSAQWRDIRDKVRAQRELQARQITQEKLKQQNRKKERDNKDAR